jgi:glyoxylase I family protein
MVTSFNHSGVVVEDLDAVLGFYVGLLGLEVVRELDSIAPPTGDHTGIPGARRKLVFVGVPGRDHLLELVHYFDPPSPDGHLERYQLGAAHVCFNVEGLEKLHADLSSSGVPFVTPPIFRETPDGGRAGVCYAQDPEGNWVEFIERTAGRG